MGKSNDIPQPEGVDQPGTSQLTDKEALRTAAVLMCEIVAFLRLRRMPPVGQRHFYVGNLPGNLNVPVVYAIAAHPWSDLQVAAIVTSKFREHGWTVQLLRGSFGIMLPPERFGYLLK